MNKPLVSIITPCYNGEKFVHRFFSMLLNQTYNNIELIFINNGSTDRTAEIANSYSESLEKKGVKFKNIYIKKNIYASGGMNEGLKHFTGKYLMWIDSDDIIYFNHVEKKVNFLEKNPNYAWLVCKCRIVDESNIDKGIGLLDIPMKDKKENLFERLIKRERVYFTGIGFMVRSDVYILANPSRSIFISETAQNWQLLLPIAYKYECAKLDLILADYVVRRMSESRVGFNRNILRTIINFEIILLETITRIKLENKDYYIAMIKEIFIKEKFKAAYRIYNIPKMNEYYKLLKESNMLKKKDVLMYYAGKNKETKFILDIIIKIKNELKGMSL